MAGSNWILLTIPALLLLLVPTVPGAYILTTPRKWIAGDVAQVCIFVTDPAAPSGSLNLSITVWDSSQLPDERNVTILQHLINVTAGEYEKCHDIALPDSDFYNGNLHLKGSLSGLKLNDTLSIGMRTSQMTFIQTDRYKYRPGEKVQFRLLTLVGNKMNVSNESYSEVWVNTPSRNRVAQWLKVDNSGGIVHLDFQLADEPEEGTYTIRVKTKSGGTTTRRFVVEEFVLPRFEVTIKQPAYILPIDDEFNYTICANYTFGQPVKGNFSYTVHNNQNRKCLVSQTNTTKIDGCADITVSVKEMKVLDCNVYSLDVSVVVEEEGTGVQLSERKTTSITRSAVHFKNVYKDEFMKPNLPYSVKLRAELPDGSPAVDVPVEVCAAGNCNNSTTTSSGILDIVLPNYKSNSVLVKALNCRAGMRSSEYTDDIEHYFSPSNSSLLIMAKEGKLKCSPKNPSDHVLSVLFSARDQPTAAITVQVVSRGHIQYTATQQVNLTPSLLPIDATKLVEEMPPPLTGTVRGVVDLNVRLPMNASPKARVLVWYSRADGEVVSDVRELEVERCLANNVTMRWSTARGQPGDAASFTLAGEPNSLCSVGVVDKSTELLSPDPDPISLDDVFNFVERFTISRWSRSQISDYDYCNRRKREAAKAVAALEGSIGAIVPIPPIFGYYSSYVDAIKMFSDAGLYVLTDLTVETRPCEEEENHHFIPFISGVGGGSGAPGFAAAPRPPVASVAFAPESISADKQGGEFESSEDPSSEAPRTNFPETWLWDLVVLQPDGSLAREVELPDTITEWVGKAVCAHPEAGIGLSDRESVITFKPFFVDLTLPPTVKRGEILPVKMSVFNYHNEDLPISLTLEDSEEYIILEEAGAPGVRGKRSACLPANGKTVLTVRVRPQEIGDVNLTVSAAVDATDVGACGAAANSPPRRDVLIRPIKVEAEGFPRENAWTKYICAKDFQTGEDSLEVWDLKLPQTLVEGSARGWVTAVGDLLALSLENLGHLIRMPYGCGEQNMLNFAPNIYLLRYLQTTRQATPEATRKLMSFMNTGYQRQLLYRRNNGSYSAFGNADDSGSTWLTAFVLKSFAQAKKYIQIDDVKLNQTRNWLLQQQDKDGCFLSVGKVLHKSMQGGVSTSKTPAPLTAYVLAALLEGGEKPNGPVLDLATQCLNTVSSRHPYTLALKAYALALAGHTGAAVALTELLDAAIVSNNSMHWKLPEGPGNSRAAAVEVAGYAIMAMMTHNAEMNEPRARLVVKWLTSHRNGQGGFYSTQDTVVALQALALFESHRHQGPLDVSVSVVAEGLSHGFSVNDNNKLLQQLVTLPTLPTNVTLGMTGEGCAVLQAVLRYNIPTPEASDAFDLTVNTVTVPDRLCVTKRITACASYRLADGASNMVVIEVNLISGYIPEKEDLKQLVKDERRIKRYEVDGSKLNFYVDELTKDDVCVNIKVIRAVDMEDLKPGTVVVYDYYEEEFSISMNYTLPPNDVCR